MDVSVLRRRAPLLVGAALSAALLAACTTAGTAKPVAAKNFDFLYSDQGTAVLVRWASRGPGPVRGTIKIDSIAGSLMFATPTDKTASFTGTVDAQGDVTFTWPGLGVVKGSESDAGLEMLVPKVGGGQQAAQFTVGSPSAYVTAVQQMEAVAKQNAQALAGQPADDPLSSLAQDVAGLNGDAHGFDQELGTFSSDVTGVGTDVATARKDAASIRRDATASRDVRCTDVRVANDDITILDQDEDLVGTDQAIVLEQVGAVRNYIDIVHSDLAAVQHALPGYHGGGGDPSPADVQAAIADANTQLAKAIAAANQTTDQSNGLLSTGYQALVAAVRIGDCGSAEEGPTPMNHIT